MFTVVPHYKINKEKWDACLMSSTVSRIYCRYDFLNCLCKNWSAIIYNDYEAIMPLTGRKKYLINYLYQPFFCASLGVFGNNISADLLKKFLNKIPEKYKYWDIYLNSGNLFSLSQFDFQIRVNYYLNLKNSYSKLFDSFSINHKRNIKIDHAFLIKKNIPVNEVIELAHKQSKKYSPIKLKDFEFFERLYSFWFQHYKAVTYGVYDNIELLASAAFLYDNSRAYYLLVGNSEAGRKKSASHILINKFIYDHAGSDMTLDFVGSNIKSIARFYKGFGAVEEKYPALKKNNISPLLRIIGK
ncbi:MAG: hypothetical protein NVSMB45_13440 [Ginsengibacter sp.]